MRLQKQKLFQAVYGFSLILGFCHHLVPQIGVLQTLVVALGAGLGIWGAINLLEGYGNDNPGANAHVR